VCLVVYYIVLSFLFINLYSFVLFMLLLSVFMLRRTTSLAVCNPHKINKELYQKIIQRHYELILEMTMYILFI